MTPNSAMTELKRLPLPELRRELGAKRVEAAKMRMGLKMQSEKNHAAYRTVRRDIARMSMAVRDLEKAAPVAVKSAEKTSQTSKKAVQSASSTAKPATSRRKKAAA